MPNPPLAPDVCHLDVAFSSDASPIVQSQPIAMAYAYVDNNDPSQTFQGRGQTKVAMAPASTFAFFIFDTAPPDPSNPTSVFNVTSVTISSVNKQPGQGKPSSPFTDSQWSTGTVVASGSNSGNANNWVQLYGPGPSMSQSTGCNLYGRNWSVGNFTVGSFNGQRFEITVTVLMSDGNQQTKSFSVDPEVVVGSGDK